MSVGTLNLGPAGRAGRFVGSQLDRSVGRYGLSACHIVHVMKFTPDIVLNAKRFFYRDWFCCCYYALVIYY